MFSAMHIFDTHKYINQLKAVGVPEAQAEVHSAALASFGEAVFDRFPTKADMKQELKLLSVELIGRMDKLEERMNGRMHRLEERVHGELTLNRWMLGTVITGVLALLVKSFS